MNPLGLIGFIVFIIPVIAAIHFATLPNEPIRTDEEENP